MHHCRYSTFFVITIELLRWCFLTHHGLLISAADALVLFPTTTRCFQSGYRWHSRLSARQRRNVEEDDDDDNVPSSSPSGIPQLPAKGSTSRANKNGSSSFDDDTTTKPFVASKKFSIQYTCNICETRNTHLISRIAYNQGVVIARCKGCESQHIIADNLGWTDYDGGFQGDTNTIEDYFGQSEDQKVTRVSHEVFHLERILKEHDTKSGAIVGDDGKLALE
jgi:protein import protein ZIM17